MDKVGNMDMKVTRSRGEIVPKDFAAAVKDIKLAILQSRARAAHALPFPRPGHRRRPPRTRQRAQGTDKEERSLMEKIGNTQSGIKLAAPGYEDWIRSIRERVQRARFKALMMANAEQILLYWDIGHEIIEKQDAEGWGSKIVERMSVDLKAAFPDMKGWSRSNLMHMRQFAEA